MALCEEISSVAADEFPAMIEIYGQACSTSPGVYL
jgi:hypothetical protein